MQIDSEEPGSAGGTVPAGGTHVMSLPLSRGERASREAPAWILEGNAAIMSRIACSERMIVAKADAISAPPDGTVTFMRVPYSLDLTRTDYKPRERLPPSTAARPMYMRASNRLNSPAIHRRVRVSPSGGRSGAGSTDARGTRCSAGMHHSTADAMPATAPVRTARTRVTVPPSVNPAPSGRSREPWPITR
jgi:hypothetical protein